MCSIVICLPKHLILHILRRQHVEIESYHNEYAINYISDAKVDSWPNRRGPYLQLLTHWVGYDLFEWMLLEQVDDFE